MRLCVWHCISLSEKPGKKEVGEGGMTKWVSKFIATPVDRGLRIGGFLFAFANEFLAALVSARSMCIRLPSLAFQLPPNESEKPTAA